MSDLINRAETVREFMITIAAQAKAALNKDYESIRAERRADFFLVEPARTS
jgi:hypothetical protein